MTRIALVGFIVAGLLCGVQAQTKLTPLKTGGGRPLPPLKAKKEAKEGVDPAPSEKEVAPPVPAFTGPKNGWGVINRKTPCYSPEGRNRGTLPAGTLLTYSAVKRSSTCFVLVSKVQRQGDAWEGPFLVEAPDVVLFSGELNTMSDELIADIRAYFMLLGQIENRKEELEKSAQSQNPHFESARLWQKRYAESVEKASDMEEQANALTGSAKTKMLDQLRALKYEQARLKIQADKEAASYKAWKDQHPVPPSVFTADTQLKDLQTQLNVAKEKIKDIVVD